MSYTVVIPDLGTDDAVEVIEVIVAVGDTVDIDEPIIVLESDKASMDIPSPKAGVVESIDIKVGDKVTQGNPILQLKLIEEVDEISSSEESSSLQVQDQSLQTVCVPELGTSDAVEVIDVCVNVGDEVDIDSPTITLESDKASMDIPSDKAGIVKEILVKVGDKLRQGDSIINVEVSNQAIEQTNKTTEPEAKAAVVNQPVSSLQSNYQSSTDNLHAGPAVRRLARELGIDLKQIRATGPRGRITKQDLIELVKSRMQGSTPVDTGIELSDVKKFGEAEAVDMSRIQKLTAKGMAKNWQTIPHVTQFDDADITELEKFRKESKSLAAEKGVKLTILPFIVKAIAIAIAELKQFNVAVGKNDQIIQKDFINISVAMDTPHGLVVPVIKCVDKKDIWQIAAEIADLYGKAVDNKLKREDIQGGCFTVSSLGSIGGKYFTPIVNAPEVAILGVSRSSMKPVYKDGEFVARNMLPLSLSFDHRVINGVDGAKMTGLLSKLLENYVDLVG